MYYGYLGENVLALRGYRLKYLEVKGRAVSSKLPYESAKVTTIEVMIHSYTKRNKADMAKYYNQ